MNMNRPLTAGGPVSYFGVMELVYYEAARVAGETDKIRAFGCLVTIWSPETPETMDATLPPPDIGQRKCQI
jgi:hypothetical protein